MVHGILPVALLVQRRIFLTELWVLFQILRCCAPFLAVYIDSQAVVDGVGRGRAWGCCAQQPRADVWRRIWLILDDVGVCPLGVDIHKCKSHVTAARCAALTESEQAICNGNYPADFCCES